MDTLYTVIMCLLSFTSYSNVSFVSPLCPDEFDRNGIPSYFVGVVFSLNPA